MIFETAPAGPRGRFRRLMRALGLLLPILLLGGVVGAGVLGPRPDPEPSGPPPAPSAAAATPRALANPPEASMPPGPSTVQIGAPVIFPGSVANLPVRRVPAVLAAQQAGLGGSVVAVAGYLRAWADPQACSTPIAGLPGGGCTRHAFLTEAPWAIGRSEGLGGIGMHLSGVVPPGVSIPDSAVGLITNDARHATPVVVVGRFGTADVRCVDDLPGCDGQFVFERVTWAGGQDVALGRQVSAGLVVGTSDPMAGEPVVAAGRTLGPLIMPLRLVLVEPADLAVVDAEAADALAERGGGAAGPVWYVRGLDAPYGRSTPVVRWAVVDPASGTILAAGDTLLGALRTASDGAG